MAPTHHPFYQKLTEEVNQSFALSSLPPQERKRISTYVASYVEDVVSGLGLWHSLVALHQQHYGRPLPFYEVSADYGTDRINEEDIRCLVWGVCQKHVQYGSNPEKREYPVRLVNPMDEELLTAAHHIYKVLERVGKDGFPKNTQLTDYFRTFTNLKDAESKLTWLFHGTYLTELTLVPYEVKTPQDWIILPTGPLALYLHQWLDALGGHAAWSRIQGIYFDEPQPEPAVAKQIDHMVNNFLHATGGKDIVFLNTHADLCHFLVHQLGWPDTENHTFPHLAQHTGFVLMATPKKGMLMAADVAPCFCTPLNTLYNKEKARSESFRLLSEEMRCPPDLLKRALREGWLQDLHADGVPDELLKENADFLARFLLQFFYHGD